MQPIATKHNGQPGIAAHRLSPEQCQNNFTDKHPALSAHSAQVEAERCYYCFDAPCTEACPTGIDVPGFIRMISSHNPTGAANLILSENIMGGTCSRVCPVETLCEQSCVRNTDEDRPVTIGLLQRYATDDAISRGDSFFKRVSESGRTVGVVGAGPAGLACAHRLALLGHGVTVYEAREKPGGLNEYGLAAYKMTADFAQKEIEYITAVGGIKMQYGIKVGQDVTFEELRNNHDALFIGVGLAQANTLEIENGDCTGVENAVEYIEALRQSEDLSSLPIGQRVVVIGGGMTAIDIASQARLLGAEEVTIVYRRGQEQMKASLKEQEFAQTIGVQIRHWAQPKALKCEDNRLTGIVFSTTAEEEGGAGTEFELPADMVFKAIGQSFVSFDSDGLLFNTEQGRLAVDDQRQTSIPGVWAGGDCIAGGDDLAVIAVQDGKIAAQSIHQFLTARHN